MQYLAFVLVLLGALMLGCAIDKDLCEDNTSINSASPQSAADRVPVYNAEAIGGIVLVGGLIIFLCNNREND